MDRTKLQQQNKPRGTGVVEELKKAISEIGYGIWKAQDALVKLNRYGVLAYNGVSITELESRLEWVERTQDWFEKESADLWPEGR
jgi:hypothetical protein